MRVIRTEEYFDGNYVKRRDDKSLKSSNICFAWIETGENSTLRSAELKDFQEARPITPSEVPLVLDYILRRLAAFTGAEMATAIAAAARAILCIGFFPPSHQERG
jgi:hypothetical protein